ncbi:response regulator [Geomonas propionica]|uniref:histidine kinase n=1 Tax=Geomonas propionica TaxID=2798582 RepID=A0ABS0YQS7_9BACT|nr:response regulator [Geomonas propionica]MBJ6800339.1 response regulator [Geomonas propionica]
MKNTQEQSRERHSSPGSSRIIRVSLAAFLLGMIVSGTTVGLYEENREQIRRQAAADLTAQVAYGIRDNLNRALSSTYALAALIRQDNGVIKNFPQLAREMLQLYPGISALQLAPSGIITEVVPLQGNEKAIGHNLLADNRRNKEALLAVRTRSLTLAGPFELIQGGGKAVIGRLPVFLKDAGGRERFWGFTTALLRLDQFLGNAQLSLLGKEYNYQISRTHPDTGKTDVFWSVGGPLRQPVSQKLEVPNGVWTVSVEPVHGWHITGFMVVEILLVLFLSSLCSLVAWWFMCQPQLLQRMVDEKTRELSESNAMLQNEVIERKHAEEALKASEIKLRSIFTSLTDVILVLDREGRYLEIAPTSTDRLYRPPMELLGQRIKDVFPKEQADLFLKTIENALDRGETMSIDYALDCNGTEVWFTGNVAPLDGDRVIWSARDITLRKRSEEERLKLEKQMLHTQKLESLGVLAGGIAHDFNNILTAIVGNADLALMRLNPESPAQENLRRIEVAASRAADLARQMLAYSGKGHFVTEELDLNTLVEEMGQMLSVSVAKKAQLNYRLSRPLPSITADATQIRQVVMNLVINASEAIGDDSGIITITTGQMECNEGDCNTGWLSDPLPPGIYVYIEVSDTGCGMDRETMAKIFDPFFTTKFTGRGLGMAAVLGIVRGHMGAIRVYSEPGRGSTFKVVLSAGTATGESPHMACAPEQSWRGSGTVLLVDDEATIRDLGSEMLGELGFEVVTAADGREGVEIFRNRRDIVLVLLDLTMPQMDGEQCFRELRRIDPQIKVVMSSGFSEHEVSRKFLGKGISAFVQKPYKLSALREVLSALDWGNSSQLR